MEIKFSIPECALEKANVPKHITQMKVSANCSLYRFKSYGDWIYANNVYLFIKEYEDYSYYAILNVDYEEIFGFAGEYYPRI